MARNQGAHSMRRWSFCRASIAVLIALGVPIAQTSKVVRRIGALGIGPPDTREVIK